MYSQMRIGYGRYDLNAEEAVSLTALHVGDQSFHSLFSFQNKAAFMRSHKISILEITPELDILLIWIVTQTFQRLQLGFPIVVSLWYTCLFSNKLFANVHFSL